MENSTELVFILDRSGSMAGLEADTIGGYNAMLERIAPSHIICFGTPFAEMEGNIIPVDYMESRKVVR